MVGTIIPALRQGEFHHGRRGSGSDAAKVARRLAIDYPYLYNTYLN
jgi:hypothetical protein